MFYFFSKTITYLFTPAGWLITSLLLAAFLRSARARRRMLLTATGIFGILGNGFLINELALSWEYPPQPVPAPGSPQIAVVLTGGMVNGMKHLPGESTASANRPGGAQNRFILGREADRAGQALYLYKTGTVQKILISGGNGDLPFQPRIVSDEAHVVAEFLRIAGVKPADIVLENKSRNTHENALFTASILRKTFGTNQCVLITSAWHMRRAVGCFTKAGVRVTPFPTGFLSEERSFSPGNLLLPREESFYHAYYFIREMVGYLTYWVVGYVE